MKSLKKITMLLYCLSIGFTANVAITQVKVWDEPMVILSWEIGPPEVNPTFAWSFTRKPVYPYPYKEILTNQKKDKICTACWLENEFVKVLVLPELGGKLYGAKDKTNDYNFFYWQPTVKPALIGMTGAWVSGGIEWNFPHGHRPSGFSPISYRLVENADGSKTIWVGETEWVNRMRWVVGMMLYPGKSVIEAMELDQVKKVLGESSTQRLSFLRKHKKVVEGRDDLLTTMLDLMVQHGQYEEALNYYLTHHFHNWEGRYSIHNAYLEANTGMAKVAKTQEAALKCYLRACELS